MTKKLIVAVCSQSRLSVHEALVQVQESRCEARGGASRLEVVETFGCSSFFIGSRTGSQFGLL